ncbi:DUF2235 domain-containing protein [Jannaschia sp. Os4]|uniref:phospholipase effector Tle1 domain-containing protein n=1 Tax=Jannaschia sp. Os4 TaxID=2807617 RepID=UPI0019395D7E|nr:DUF2235 domain-containing protein [Jannaschia sp. Os4]MBM2575797.1 DUF2235 domain-containing protein [Jannaschia sp. Os4]
MRDLAAASGASGANVDAAVETCPAVVINYGVFFDGTFNSRDNAETGFDLRARGDEATGNYGTSVTHPALLERHYFGSEDRIGCAHNDDRDAEVFFSDYQDGIGSESKEADENIGGGSGYGGRGINAKADQALTRLRNYLRVSGHPWRVSEVRVDVFGFSRGAAAARVFANALNALALRHVRIRFIGLFDTVVAAGNPMDTRNLGFNTSIGNDTAETVVQLTALHEIRQAFALSSIKPGPGREIALPGVHGTIGGMPLDELETLLIRYPEQIDLYQAQGLIDGTFEPRPGLDMRRTYESDAAALSGRANPGEIYDPIRTLTRTVLPGLRILSLEVMYELAVRAGVPFHPLRSPFPLPPQFADLKATVLAGGALSDEQMNLVRRHISPSARDWGLVHPVEWAELDRARDVIANRPGQAE